MELNINIGIAKAILNNKVTNEFINESKINDSTKIMSSFIDTIKKHPVLINEFSIFYNIEKKYSDNDILATKFIDRNIATLSKYSPIEINEAHEKLKPFIIESEIKDIPKSKIELYNSIATLINESISTESDINESQVAYENVLTYIKNNVHVKEEQDTLLKINENIDVDSVISIATRIYNERFSSLNENERKIVNTIVYSSNEDKKTLLEDLKQENINILKSLESNGIEDKINEAIHKVNSMQYQENTLTKNIIELIKLKESLN